MGDRNYTGIKMTDGKINGPGEVTYKDENGKKVKYTGHFKDGKKEGKGLLKFMDNGTFYFGDFKDDKYDGYGVFVEDNDNCYKGGWKGGVHHGKGELWKGKDYFKGEFVNGKPRE